MARYIFVLVLLIVIKSQFCAEERREEKLVGDFGATLYEMNMDPTTGEFRPNARSIPLIREFFAKMKTREEKIAAMYLLDGYYVPPIPIELYPEILSKFMKDADLSVRRRAADVLSRFDSYEIVSRLHDEMTMLVKDGDDEIKLDIISAMGAEPDFFSPQLLGNLKHEKFEFRRTACSSLSTGGEKYKVPIAAMLADENPRVISTAINSLKELNAVEYLTDIVGFLDHNDSGIRHAALSASFHLGKTQVADHIARRLNDTDISVQYRAAEYLGILEAKQYSREVSDLLKAKINSRSFERGIASVIQAVGKLGDASDLTLIEPFLEHENTEYRKVALRALFDMSKGWAGEKIAALLKDDDVSIRLQALGYLGDMKAVRLMDQIAAALTDVRTRRTAIETIGNIGNTSHLSLIEPYLSDDAWEHRLAALEALVKLGNQQVSDQVAKMLHDPEDSIRYRAVIFIGQLHAVQHVDAVVALLKDESVFPSAIDALGSIGNASHVPLIEPFLNHEEHFIRSSSLDAIYKLGKEQAITAIASRLKDPDESMRWHAMIYLGEFKATAYLNDITPLLKGTQSDRDGAIIAIGDIGGRTQLSLIEPYLEQDDSGTRQIALRVIADVEKQQAAKKIASKLKDPIENLRCDAAYLIGELQLKDYMDEVEKLLNDIALPRRGAIEAIGKIGNESHIPLIKKYLLDEDSYCREAAADAIKALRTKSVTP